MMMMIIKMIPIPWTDKSRRNPRSDDTCTVKSVDNIPNNNNNNDDDDDDDNE